VDGEQGTGDHAVRGAEQPFAQEEVSPGAVHEF
jgi:hypothetical protein